MQLEVISREPTEKLSETPLLFIHGSGHGAWCWEENFLDYFAARGFSSHAVSLRGHGNSEGKDKLRWASVKDYVSDVAQIADRFQNKPVVIGHSLGGLVVQKYLEGHEAPAGVLLASSPVSGMFRDGTRLFFRKPFLFLRVFATMNTQKIYGTRERVHDGLFSKSASKTKIAGYSEKIGEESFRAFLEMLFLLPNPKLIKSPLLVIGAANDRIVSQSSILKTAQSYRADVKIFPDMAHDLMLEEGWETVAQFICSWLKTRLVK
ncbi:MAG TPA: alpha/beta fold hydrolase [Pyrinomonadaceae bacterium]|jgi:pimeloyl-ACP methyl ester carboxylesterase